MSRRMSSAEESRNVPLPADTWVSMPATTLAAGLVDIVGEAAPYYFARFWANGDGLEVRFRRVPLRKRRR